MWQYPDVPLALSDPTVEADFMQPYDKPKSALTDWARGGVALLDANSGLNVKNWFCEAQENGGVYLSSAGAQPFKIETLVGKPTWISFCFDQNMHYNIAYIVNSHSFFYWYDANQQGYTTTDIGAVNTPFCRLDDVRRHPSFWNDIVLSYIRGAALCARLQRDRFSIEYVLAENAGSRIIQCGMNKKLRFQWHCA